MSTIILTILLLICSFFYAHRQTQSTVLHADPHLDVLHARYPNIGGRLSRRRRVSRLILRPISAHLPPLDNPSPIIPVTTLAERNIFDIDRIVSVYQGRDVHRDSLMFLLILC